jgi:hypothetical protein
LRNRSRPLPAAQDDLDSHSKRSVSLRIDHSDFAKVKAIAERLRARESDVFRFAIKIALAKLAPLFDERIAGGNLMPVFIECGAEITSHFNLDARRLEIIINGAAAAEDDRVATDDIELLAMSAMPERYLSIRLKDLAKKPIHPDSVHAALREYLNDKYVARAEEYWSAKKR